MKLLDKSIYKLFNLFIFLLFIFYTTILFSKNIFDTNFYNIEKFTENITKTKEQEINKIKLESLKNILDKILLNNDKKIFFKKFDFDKDIQRIVKNIIIEDELIIQNKYIANVKINFDNKEIIQLLRNYKINYTDISSNNFLVISSFSDEFDKYGLSNKNLFYQLNKYNLKNQLINISFPDLSANDRFILPVKKILDKDIKAFTKISNKYDVNHVFLLNIKKDYNDSYSLDISLFSVENRYFEILTLKDIEDYNIIYDEFVSFIISWWKSTNLVNNKIITSIDCNIKSKNYSDLINIKKTISNLNQFKSINLKIIDLNNNFEEVIFYGEYEIFRKSLLQNNVRLIKNDYCVIESINK